MVARQAALIILVSALLGNMFWGYVVDRMGQRQPRNKLTSLRCYA